MSAEDAVAGSDVLVTTETLQAAKSVKTDLVTISATIKCKFKQKKTYY